MKERKQECIAIFVTVMLVLVLLWSGKRTAADVTAKAVNARKNGEKKQVCVVLDAGHGGTDPGKVGINKALEKDINLEIVMQLKALLEQEDVKVVLTRETKEGLCDPGASNGKVQDMKRRIEIIDEAEADITVSIHQNSYPQEAVRGAQVFYYTGSKEGEKLAEKIQDSLVRRTDQEKKRQIKANDSYYMLKKTQVPIVIVECGFLSNSAEAEMLCTEEYQKKIAWAIHMGILQYINEALYK